MPPPDKSTPKLINGVPVVGVCDRCGRGFLSMPKDGIDHYGRRTSRRAGTDFVTCGGKVSAINTEVINA